jgi:hypothetical protein
VHFAYIEYCILGSTSWFDILINLLVARLVVTDSLVAWLVVTLALFGWEQVLVKSRIKYLYTLEQGPYRILYVLVPVGLGYSHLEEFELEVKLA